MSRAGPHISPPDDAWAVALLEDLLRTPSVSGAERAAAELFTRRARERGLEAHIDGAGNAVVVRRSTRAPAPGERIPEICLLGHIDTVPGDIPVRREAGVLHGRGAVDAKGPLAAFLVAALRLPSGAPVDVTVVGAVGEETPDSPGAHHVVRGPRPDACIIGEPTGVHGFALGYKGRLLVDATFEKDAAHSAGPGGSACDAALEWWRAAADAARRLAIASPAGAFDSMQASVRGMSSETDGLRERATLRAGFRLPPGVTPHALEGALRAIESPGAAPALTFAGHTPPFRAPRDNAVAAALSAAIRASGGAPRPLVKTGTADMNIAGPAWGCPIAAYGPGDSALDHTPHERIEIAEYLRAIDILAAALPDVAARCAPHATACSAGSPSEGSSCAAAALCSPASSV